MSINIPEPVTLPVNLREQLQALKNLSEQLLNALQADLEDVDGATVSQLMGQRDLLLKALAKASDTERQALKATDPALIQAVETLGQQCMEAVQHHTQQRHAHQQHMNQGRHLLQAYQPQETEPAHFIEGDA